MRSPSQILAPSAAAALVSTSSSFQGLSSGWGPQATRPHPPLRHPPAPPVILGDTEELVEEVTINASSTVSLQCPALGNPTPTISWLQNGLPFSPSPRLQVLEEGQVLQVRTAPRVDSRSNGCLDLRPPCLGARELPFSVPVEAFCLKCTWDLIQPNK